MRKSRGFSLIQTKQVRVGFSTGAFLPLAKRILKDLHPELAKNGFIEIVWVSDKAIKQLNKQYRKKDQATDILSFSYGSSPDPEDPFGQLIISAPMLRKQAKAHKHPYYIEAEILFVHGMLHLLGYDHEMKKDFEEMKKLEQKYLGDKSGLVHRSTVE